MNEPWLPGGLWDACMIPPVRCAQCCRYIPSETAVEDLLKDMAALCDDCYRMQRRAKR
jgi:hypothetical protein